MEFGGVGGGGLSLGSVGELLRSESNGQSRKGAGF